jgi:hypothetical protein
VDGDVGWKEGTNPSTGFNYLTSFLDYRNFESKCCDEGVCSYPCGYSQQNFWDLGQGSGGPWEVGGGNQYDDMARGSIGIKPNGTLWAWGCTEYMKHVGWNSGSKTSPYQLGSSSWRGIIGPDNGDISDYYSTKSIYAFKTDGTLWVWGQNDFGQLGLGNTVSRSSPVQLGTGTNWDTASFGNNGSSYPFVLALKYDGTLWSWGNNTYGQLGLGNTVSRSSPVQVGTGTNWAEIASNVATSAAIKTDGTLWTWGAGLDGRLGLGADTSSRSSPVQVGTGTNWRKVFVTYGGMAALKTDNSLWVWGRAAKYGRTGGANTSSPVQIGTSTDYGDFVNTMGTQDEAPTVICNDQKKLFYFSYNWPTRYSGCVLGGPYYVINDRFQMSKYKNGGVWYSSAKYILTILKTAAR